MKKKITLMITGSLFHNIKAIWKAGNELMLINQKSC